MMEFKINKCKEYEPYSHQTEIADILDKMENQYGNYSTIINVPTGGGKTKIAIDFCRKVLNTRGNKILWLTDSIDLLTQSIDRCREVALKNTISYQLVCGTTVSYDQLNNRWGRGSGNVVSQSMKEIECDTDILFASVETIRNYKRDSCCELNRWIEHSQISGKLYIIYDEVHHIGADKTEPFLKEITTKAEKCVLIGLTATVYRYDSPIDSFNRWFKCGWDNKTRSLTMDKSELGISVDGFINNRINIVDINRLVNENLLVKADIIRVDDFKAGMPEPIKLEGRTCHDNEMKYLARKIEKTYKRKGAEWNKTIIFVDDIKSAICLKAELDKLNVDSFTYISGDNQYDDKDLNEFKNENSTDCKIMIAVDMATEGFDVKNIETIYLYSKILSHIVLRQRIGRVLRKATNKDKATVYWQKFYNKKNYKNYDDIEFDDVLESEEEIQRDIGRWKKGLQLPAGMYLEPLPVDDAEERQIYKRYEFLQILDKFGLEITINGISYYNCDGRKVYARYNEQEGYEQFWHMIKADYYSCLIRQEKYERFGDYAKALGVTERILLDDIKLNCFYLSDVKKSDGNGKIDGGKRFIVTDDDIKFFYEYVISHDLQIPELIQSSSNIEDLEEKDSDDKIEELQSQVERTLYEEAIIEEQMKAEGVGKQDNLLDAIKLQQKLREKYLEQCLSKQKSYTDILTYGKDGEYLYQQLLSAKTIIKFGAIDKPREKGTLKGFFGELAFMGKDEGGNYIQIKALPRVVNRQPNDNLLYAQALISIPNQITVLNEDVIEYEEQLCKVLEENGVQIGTKSKEKITREFIMALGYVANQDDIIRMQCDLFDGKLPRLLQYVIYCKCYERLAGEIDFINDGILSTIPSEKMVDKLKKECNNIFSSYGNITLDENLTPIEDIIIDYRPYVKAVPYYQGIKPEFLCRMLNDMLVLADKKKVKFCDAFGGSGTISLNMYEQLHLEQTYNDLGIFNKAFFDTLKDFKKQDELKCRIEYFIDLVFNNTGDDEKNHEFLKPYLNILEYRHSYLESCKENEDGKIIVDGKAISQEEVTKQIYSIDELTKKLRASLQEKYDIYAEKYDKISETSGQKRLYDRLKDVRNNYCKILSHVCNDIDDLQIQEVEKHVHAILLDLLKFFYETVQINNDNLLDKWSVDFAFAFFVLNFYNRQGFFNSASISRIAYFVGAYKQYIDLSSGIISKIKIRRKDAVGLIDEMKDIQVWYFDIPYSETDSRTYCEEWFDEVTFVNNLSDNAGDYVVASRYNTCENLNDKHFKERRTLKQYGIVKFFSRFVTSEIYDKYKEVIKKEYADVNEIDMADTDYNAWNCINSRMSAKYICFAYTKNEEIKDQKHYKVVSSVSEDSIRRMLERTQFSKIPIEIMLTNMDMHLNKNRRVHKISEGIWCMPTFATKSAYHDEPLTIIMDYEMFYEKMILTLLSNAYESEKHKDFAMAFADLYRQKK